MDPIKHEFFVRQDFIRDIPPRMVYRILDHEMGKTSTADHIEQPFLRLASNDPNLWAPWVNASKARVAFGRWAIPILKRQLLIKDSQLVYQALASLLDMVHDPEKCAEVIRLFVPARLVRLMVAEDSFVREQVATILMVIAGNAGGRVVLTENRHIVDNLKKIVADSNNRVRSQATLTLKAIASNFLVVRRLVELCFIPIIIRCLDNELEETIVVQQLEVLELLLDDGDKARQQGLNFGIIGFSMFLDSNNPAIRARFLLVLAQVAVILPGKEQAIQVNMKLTAKLVELVSDQDIDVRVAACQVLMFTVITTEGKLQTLEAGVLDPLLQCCFKSSDTHLQVNAVKALTSLAEAPKGRVTLRTMLPDICAINTNGCANLIKHIQVLVSTINWMP